jgi:hypothetical protein
MKVAEGMYQPFTTNSVTPLQGTSTGRASAVSCAVDILSPRGKPYVTLVLLNCAGCVWGWKGREYELSEKLGERHPPMR